MLNNNDQPLSVAQASSRLGIHRTTTYKLLESGKLEGYRVGTAIRINRSSVDKYKLENSMKKWG